MVLRISVTIVEYKQTILGPYQALILNWIEQDLLGRWNHKGSSILAQPFFLTEHNFGLISCF